MSLNPPHNHELVYGGTILKGDKFWSTLASQWFAVNERIGKSVEAFQHPIARPIRANWKDDERRTLDAYYKQQAAMDKPKTQQEDYW